MRQTAIILAWFLVAAAVRPGAAGAAHSVLVEAESFSIRGGWVIDTQSIDQMGSAYLLAHGLGVPVEDATTAIDLPAPGRYRVWVRTRDWVAPWKVPGAPGRFQLLVDGRALATTFGTEGADWHWQDGGTIDLAGRRVKLALHDLTGFDGRCDAILLTTDSTLGPPNEGPALASWRRRLLGLPCEPPEAGRFDLVVVGGGMAGCCTAVSAARLGVKVALIQNRPVLGGNNSSEVRVGLSGQIHQPPYPRLGDLVDEIGPIGYWNYREALANPDDPRSRRILEAVQRDPRRTIHNAGPASNYCDDKKLRIVSAEPNIRLFLNMHAIDVEKEGARIRAVIALSTVDGHLLRFPARWFVDCTGDGNLGFLAGADFRMGRESRAETGESLAPEQADRMVMGTSVQWYSVLEETPSTFPRCPWAVRFDEQTCQPVKRGDWDWETGMNRNQITEIEYIRDYALRVIYGNWSYLKNDYSGKKRFARRRLAWVAYIGGKRESRRLLGDVILTEQDILQRRAYPDACVTTTWGIDLHFPHPENSKHFPGGEFRSIARTTRIRPYPIPFRCLYSRNVPNLMMAGRDISVTHVALGTVRVQRTTGMMGEVVGMAASLCKKHNVDPRGVYERHLDELKELMRRGVGKASLRRTSAEP
ncbi:MAG TPA: FAD-dependent oxidoreductase [Planctomycetaceae bacterium]|nr:FAD-dependent oxidoreductase [Planctomycetaceae bacterium]